MKKPKILAYYLPQFHEIQENNEWWGEGFTEWTALNSAKSYFKSQNIRKPISPYYQYELPSKDVMEWQAKIARDHHIDGFFVWDYWFGNGKRLLSKPKEYVRDHGIDFPYALIWANHSWYNKGKNILLMEQQYLGKKDYYTYAMDCLSHFVTDNYIKINNAPVFGIFMPSAVPDLQLFIETFEFVAINNGFSGIYWVAENSSNEDVFANSFNAVISSSKYFSVRKWKHPLFFIREQLIKRFNWNFMGPICYDYRKLVSSKDSFESSESPAIFSGWDTTPRHGNRGTYLENFNNETFSSHLDNVFQHAIIYQVDFLAIKSWNEWAEGNVLEPDSEFGYSLLSVIKNKIKSSFDVGGEI